MTKHSLSVKFSVLNIIKCLMAFSFCVVFCAYAPSEDDNIRFGNPGGKGKKIAKTGFTIMYDGIKKAPLWISYHLKKENIVINKMKPGVFRPDKALEPYERTLKEDYPPKFDKCPMAPILDMVYDPKIYSDAFLLSNTCAMNPDLKRIKWRELEEQVRALAEKYGSLWVVTGPVFDYKGKKIGVFGSRKIALPTGFYKVLLYQGKDNSFHSIGFYMDNTRQEKPLKTYMMAVDDIEKMTGLDFFSLLPVEVQAIMEKQQKIAD